ncbi:MAG: outer membrane beta-barrel protein [Acidobacteria bacterium]|nr:outer membrane beta-barrel protein [Acidobacteriota bacterium]
MRFRITALALLLGTGCFAQVAEFSVSAGGVKLSNADLGSSYKLDASWRLAFAITLNNWRYFGHEFGYAYNRAELKFANQSAGGMAIHQGFYHFLAYALPEGSPVRPFASGGGHFSNFVPPGASATQGQGENKFGFNYGGGVKFRMGEKWMFRVDLRQYVTGKPFADVLGGSGALRQNVFTVGFGVGI